MGGERSTGRLEVRLGADRIIEICSVGFVTRAAMVAAQRELEAIYARDPGPYDVVWDPSRLEAFEPGLPALWARWASAHTAHVRRAAAVTRSHSLAAVVRAVNVLVPAVTRSVFETRAEALEFLRREAAANTARTRRPVSQTHVRRNDLPDAPPDAAGDAPPARGASR